MREIKEMNRIIGENIRYIREYTGHTQEELAEILGITPNHVSSIERGVSGASTRIIKEVAELYSISTDFIYFGNLPDKPVDPLIERLKSVKPELRPPINEVLTAMLKALKIQESNEQ